MTCSDPSIEGDNNMRLSVFIKIFIILILLMVITISVASSATIEEGHLGSPTCNTERSL